MSRVLQAGNAETMREALDRLREVEAKMRLSPTPLIGSNWDNVVEVMFVHLDPQRVWRLDLDLDLDLDLRRRMR